MRGRLRRRSSTVCYAHDSTKLECTVKIVVALVILLSLEPAVHSQVFEDLRPGEYAFYVQEMGDQRFYRGYWYLGGQDPRGDSFFIQNVNLLSGEEARFSVKIGRDAAGSFHIADLEGPKESTSAELLGGVVDLLNFATMYYSNRSRIAVNTLVDDSWDHYTIVYHFSKLLPFLRFRSIARKGEALPLYTLDRAGMLSLKDADRFWKMRPVAQMVESRRPEPPVLKTHPSIPVELGGYRFELDDRWLRNQDTSFLSYWLATQTVRDSVLMVERGLWVTLQSRGYKAPEEFLRNVLLHYGTVLYGTLHATGDGAQMTLSFECLDTANQRNFARLETWIEGQDLVTVNFASFAAIYQANLEYYQKILESRQPVGASR